MDLQAFAHNLSHLHPGIKRFVRDLKDELHMESQASQGFSIEVEDVLASKENLSGGWSMRLKIDLPVVVLPQPLSPTSPRVSPFRMETRRHPPHGWVLSEEKIPSLKKYFF